MAFSMYEGESKKGKRHGLGRYVYSDGAVYEGLWENDKCNGWGVYTFPDGEGYGRPGLSVREAAEDFTRTVFKYFLSSGLEHETKATFSQSSPSSTPNTSSPSMPRSCMRSGCPRLPMYTSNLVDSARGASGRHLEESKAIDFEHTL